MKFRKITALLLVLCMAFSLSISAFAAEEHDHHEHTVYESAPDEEIAVQSASGESETSGTIPGSSIKWSLDSNGWLTISGSGEAPVFQSADDQPWATVREEITEVWFEDMETLSISDLAYWFEGCTNLTTAELPLAPVIGKHAFYGCSKLSTLTMYYGETVLKSIGEDAFWRETDSGDTLYIAYLIGYPEATVPFYTYDWAASNRSDRYFYDLYGVYSSTPADSSIKKAPGASVQSTGTIIGNCPSCGKYAFQGTYVEVAHSSRGHANYNECNSCHYVQYLGTYTYKSHGAGAYGSGTCPDCGSHTWVLDYESAATCTSNGYRSYSCVCGQTKSETIYASGHSYSYGSWTQYSSSQHRRESYCRNCGDSDYEYASHSMSYYTSGGGFMQHILIVEDDLDIQDLLRNFLQEVGYEITIASDGMEAIALFSSAHFDLILLDIMLPKIDGFTVCELIRKQSQVPIIMLTALNGEEEQIRGLDLQVDDYITKPFSMPILVRKIGAVLRRSSMIPEQEHQTITYKNLVLDMDSYTAVVDGVSFDLTQREFEVLRELLLNQGRVLTRQNLLDKLWRYDFYGDERVVDTHIKNLRKKLGIDFIQTIRGVGYKIDKEN